MGKRNPITKIINKIIGGIKKIIKGIGKFFSGIFGGFTPDIPDVNTSQSAEGVLVTKAGTNLDIPVIYGFRRVGGRVIFAETGDDNNKFLWVVYVIAEGEIHKIKRIFIDDAQLPTPGGDNFAFTDVHNITTGRYADRLQIQVFAGTENQGQSVLANQSTSWSKRQRKLPGVAYCVARYEWKKITSQADADNNPYTGGIPNIKFDVCGKKVYNFINHGGGEDLANDYADLTKTYSYNPINALGDYLMNPRYGCGIDKTEINADAFKVAAQKCNRSVGYSGDQDGKILTCNTVLGTSTRLMDNTKILLTGARAFMPYIQGRYKVKIEDGGNATDILSTTVESAFDVTTDHLVGKVSLQGEQKQNKYNQVIVNYVDPDLEFTEQQQVYKVTADRTADGEDLIGQFTFPTISNRNMAYNIAKMIYEKSRKQRYIEFDATPELLAAEPGDIIRITSSVLDLTTQTFRITNMDFNDDGTVKVQAREHDATIYPHTQGEQIEIPAPPYLPSSYTLTPLSKANPEIPIQVLPPDDPEPPQDPGSTGDLEPGDPPVQPILPPAPDPPEQDTVKSFMVESMDQFNARNDGTIVTQTHNLLYGANALNSSIIFRGSFSAPAGMNTFPTGDGKTADLSFYTVVPTDSNINRIKFYIYTRDTAQLSRIVEYNIARADIQIIMIVRLTAMSNKMYVRPMYYNSTLDKEYADGSVGTFTALSYQNLNNNTVSGYGLEAMLNNHLQSSAMSTYQGELLSTSAVTQNLQTGTFN